ncbi:WW domain-containing adapter protein with coiled-coil-like [Artemia franciscana]
MRIGDWTEHISSSGKKYFYNAKTEVSQWEKPREWLEWEKKEVDRQERQRNHDKSKDRDRVQTDRHSNYSGTPGSKSNGIKRSSSDHSTVEMEMSPGDSTPTSETSEKRPRLEIHDSLASSGFPKLSSQTAGITLGSQRIPSYPLQSTKDLSVTALKSLEQTEFTQQEALKTLHAALLAAQGAVSSDVDALSNGPPTPTHSESHDSDHRKASSVVSDSISQSAPSLSSIGPSMRQIQPQISQTATLTPSLANHFKPGLLGHVSGWPAEGLERQAQRTNDEMQNLGNLHCTKVSCELKMSRSLVRITDIQSTLQEQRLLFLRQQIKELDGMKSLSFSFT